MKIGVLSDTHMRNPDQALDLILDQIFSETDLILHAGDIVTQRVLDHLEEKGVVSVCGNMDDYEVAGTLPQTRVLKVAGKRIGLIHGWGAKQGLEERIVALLRPENPDLIVYGHSHVPFWGEVQGIQVFNPGTAAAGNYGRKATVGLIEIVNDNVEARIIAAD
jgi:putative phosphoesterase